MAAFSVGSGQEASERSRGIIDYIASEHSSSFERLYTDRYTSLAVFRSLPTLARLYVMRCLPFSSRHPFDEARLQSWLKTSARVMKPHQAALECLLRLRLISRTRENMLIFNASFCQCLQDAICTVKTEREERHSAPKNRPSLDDLSCHAIQCWERALHYIIGSTEFGKPSKSVQNLLATMQLVIPVSRASSRPTCEGLKFLFRDLHAQLWSVIIGYISNVESRGLEKSEVLSFLFRLGCLEVGKEYPCSSLSKAQAIVVDDLSELGVVHKEKRSDFFYPTSLASTLTSGSSASLQASRFDGFLCVETTFKVYAYATSTLQIALLRAFCVLETRVPNLVVCRITKRSVRNALSLGLRASEIIGFLQEFAHPVSTTSRSVPVPENVSDQIRLWENERKRMDSQSAALFRGFDSVAEFQDLLAFATKNDFVLWSSEKKKMFVTKPEAVDAIRQYRQQR